MRLTENFTLTELMGGHNAPEAVREKLLYLATYILQPIRDRFGALQITSGYRPPEYNAQIPGASPTSQHVKGEAADFIPLEAELYTVYDWITKTLRYGQAIREHKGKDWIHISLPRFSLKPNQEALVFKNGVYRPYGQT